MKTASRSQNFPAAHPLAIPEPPANTSSIRGHTVGAHFKAPRTVSCPGDETPSPTGKKLNDPRLQAEGF